MKRLIVLSLGALAVVFISLARAQVGPNTITAPYATATQCAAATPTASNQTQLFAASTPAGGGIASRLCYVAQNFSATVPVAFGDAVSATQGMVANVIPSAAPTGSAGGSVTICVTSALNACGIGGSAIVGATQITR